MPVSPEDWRHGGFGLYLHWPFCQAKCPYCDFNSHVVSAVDQSRWARAFVSEIERIRRQTGPRVLQSVFFGGGTPSLMLPETVATIMDAVRGAWTLANDLEVTLEANPTSAEAGRFGGYRDAGINRVSLGLQALDDVSLKRLGRLHTAAEGLAAYEMARQHFDRVNFDLIYARQDQERADWERELSQALALGPDHLALYQLTIEDGTAFGDRFRRGKLPGLPKEELAADLYELTQVLCAEAGLPAYEVSNHARGGQGSRHNRIYWLSGDWAGIGPGAHGRLTLDGTRLATECLRMPGAWLNAVEAKGSGELPREVLDAEAWLEELMLMGLRLDEGVDMSRISGKSPSLVNNISELSKMGLVNASDDQLILTAKGRPILNSVLTELFR